MFPYVAFERGLHYYGVLIDIPPPPVLVFSWSQALSHEDYISQPHWQLCVTV